MLSTAGLSLEQAPPISVPLRFFVTAPLFACVAGLIVAWHGDGVIASRWTPPALAVVHLITLGSLTQVMCGALFQMLPVLAGAPVHEVAAVGRWTHGLLAFGTVGLCVGFLGGGPMSLIAGTALVSAGLVVFVVAAARALVRPANVSRTVRAMRLAVISLAVTLGLGLALVSVLSGLMHLNGFADWVDLHLAWGLLGWAGILIMGVGYQVVPMFHVTPAYPRVLTALWAPLTFAGLLLASVLTGMGLRASAGWAIGVAIVTFVTFGLTTLDLQRRRQRRRADATLFHWWSAMAAAVGAAVVWLVNGPEILLGVLVLVGVAVGLPSGMLFKIVPFLGWFHLQHKQVATGRFDCRIPTMHSFVPERAARAHFWVHLVALVSLAAAVTFIPPLATVGGLALALSSALLTALLLRCAVVYRRSAVALGGVPDAMANRPTRRV